MCYVAEQGVRPRYPCVAIGDRGRVEQLLVKTKFERVRKIQ